MPFTIPVHFIQSNSHIDWKLSGEYRARFERRVDRDFRSNVSDNESDLLQRARVTLDWKANDKVSGAAQYQYAFTTFWKPTKQIHDENSQLSQLYVKFKNEEGDLTLGRQRINVGSERLVGSGDWTAVGRTYDGARFQNKRFDAFFARIGAADPWPPNVRVGAITHPWSGGSTSLIYKSDSDPTGKVELFTLSHTMTQQWSGFDFDADGALQTGRNKGKDQEAWAFHVGATRPLNATTKATLELNAASGGSDANTVRTFDNLFPTNHKFYGMMDMFAWKNMTHTALSVVSKSGPDLDFKGRLLAAWLRDPRDFWYGANGKPNASNGVGLRDLTGASGTSLGNEADFEVVWRRNPKETLSGGFGVFDPGTFVKKRTGEHTKQVYGYLMYGIKF